MGKRRRNLFVLLFVFGLILVSGIVIANKPTKLGLDLKGGVQLVLQGRPTPQQPTLDNGSMEKAVDIIRSGCDQLGVSEIEVARVGSDQIQVGIPGATSVGKATECATKPARLFFFDWEPNLIGREFLIGGHPGTEPPKGPLAGSDQRMAGSRPPADQARKPAADRRRRLPDRVRRGEAGLRTEAETGLPKMQLVGHLLPVREGQRPQADRRARVHRRRPLHHAQRQETLRQTRAR